MHLNYSDNRALKSSHENMTKEELVDLVDSLKTQVNIYKPLFLSLVTLFAFFAFFCVFLLVPRRSRRKVKSIVRVRGPERPSATSALQGSVSQVIDDSVRPEDVIEELDANSIYEARDLRKAKIQPAVSRVKNKRSVGVQADTLIPTNLGGREIILQPHSSRSHDRPGRISHHGHDPTGLRSKSFSHDKPRSLDLLESYLFQDSDRVQL